VLRARRTQRKPGDVTVKLRPMLPGDVPPELRQLPGFKVEIDASPVGYTCSSSLTTRRPDRKVKELLNGDRQLVDLLDDDQQALLNATRGRPSRSQPRRRSSSPARGSTSVRRRS
jgi:hypothetical protein